jgi:hypothetical protein
MSKLESTCDNVLTAADPDFAYRFGMMAGTSYAAQNPSFSDPAFSRFAYWRRDNRERLTFDSLRQMGAAFLDKPKITEPEALTWLRSYASFLPDSHDLEAVLYFCDGWYWATRNSREAIRQKQINAQVAKRRQEEAEAWRKKWPGHRHYP